MSQPYSWPQGVPLSVAEVEWRGPVYQALALGTTTDNSGSTVTNPFDSTQVDVNVLTQIPFVSSGGVRGRAYPISRSNGWIKIWPVFEAVAGVIEYQVWRIYVGRTITNGFVINGQPTGWYDNACRDVLGAAYVSETANSDVVRWNVNEAGVVSPVSAGGNLSYVSNGWALQAMGAQFILTTVRTRATTAGLLLQEV